MPNATADVIYFGPTTCSYDKTQHDNETIVCELDDTRVSGEWKAQILTEYGLVPSQITQGLTVPVNAASITPEFDVNYLGGDIMTITGDNFGYDKDAVSVTYNDGTLCNVTEVTMTQIICENDRFTSYVAGQNQQVTININGVEDNLLSVSTLS